MIFSARRVRIDTGILGSKYILRALCDNGRPDVALALATQTEYPSWGYKIRKGATTLWETWHGSGSIDSLNHVMFGDISAWMMQYIAGIRPATPGYKEVLLRPELMNGLALAQATHESPYGTILSSWRVEGTNVSLNVVIPPNATGLIHLPLLDTPISELVVHEGDTVIWQNGAAAERATGIGWVGVDDRWPQEFLMWRVGAGEYQFTRSVVIQKPKGVFAQAGDRKVSLRWNPVVGATSYKVKRAGALAGPFVQWTTVTNTTFEDHLVQNGQTYFNVVSAVTTNGESGNSEIASAMPKLDLNLGFESKRISNYQYNPSGAVWTFSGATDNGSGLIANGSGFSNPNAPEGTQAAFVQRLGTISQTFSGFVPGSNYTIRFAAAQRPGSNQHGGQSWDVKIDGNVIASYNPGAGATTYVDYQASFTATATNHILTFAGSNFQGGDNTVFIDHIRFSPPLLAPVVEREPATVESAGIVDGRFFLSGYGTPGQPAVLVTATNLATPIEWVSVATNPPDPEGAFVFSNLFVTNLQQFYRVMVP